ncbi:MAG: hypothetical protein MJ104_03635 [Lachnospiraceae bacterium]|nr:hypothetical protein [Lachnospiraceae bacterium]
MNFFKKLFSKKKNIEPEAATDERDKLRSGVNFNNPEERSRYIMDCLEKMEIGAREVEMLTGEYQLVTEYLTDTEEIDALPEEQHFKLETVAKQLVGYDAEIKRYREKKNRMSDIDYYTLRSQESEVEEGIAKLREGERYAVKIKKDLRRLDGERQANEFRKLELKRSKDNYKGMVGIFVMAYIFCMLLLVFFQFGLGMSVFIGYILATAVVAIACAVAAIKYIDCDKEQKLVHNTVNKLIKLQNTVKIRYVNNRKLLEYLYLKYHVENSEKLEKMWHLYQQEKEDRRQFIEAEAGNEYATKQLMALLTSYRIKYPDRWLFQTPALIDKREMVEIRHDLILRRQAIREQMDGSRKLSDDARDEIAEVSKQYPEYAKEILELVDSTKKSIN